MYSFITKLYIFLKVIWWLADLKIIYFSYITDFLSNFLTIYTYAYKTRVFMFLNSNNYDNLRNYIKFPCKNDNYKSNCFHSINVCHSACYLRSKQSTILKSYIFNIIWWIIKKKTFSLNLVPVSIRKILYLFAKN